MTKTLVNNKTWSKIKVYIFDIKRIIIMVQSISSSNIDPTAGTSDVKTAIAVKMMKEMQESQQIAGSIIQDTVEVSQEAIAKCQAECT